MFSLTSAYSALVRLYLFSSQLHVTWTYYYHFGDTSPLSLQLWCPWDALSHICPAPLVHRYLWRSLQCTPPQYVCVATSNRNSTLHGCDLMHHMHPLYQWSCHLAASLIPLLLQHDTSLSCHVSHKKVLTHHPASPILHCCSLALGFYLVGSMYQGFI